MLTQKLAGRYERVLPFVCRTPGCGHTFGNQSLDGRHLVVSGLRYTDSETFPCPNCFRKTKWHAAKEPAPCQEPPAVG